MIVLLFVLLAAINAFNVDNSQQVSYIDFEGSNSFIETKRGSLEFSFTTNMPYGVLMESKNGNNVLLTVELYKGMLKVCYKKCDDAGRRKAFEMVLLGSHWNDMTWHRVQIYFHLREIKIFIEDYESMIVTNKNDTITTTARFDSTIRISGGGPQYGITGCMKDISYPIGTKRYPQSMIGDVNTRCLNTCTTDEKRTCLNDGKCVKLFSSNVLCDCIGTGYTGEYCTEYELITRLDRETYISDIINQNLIQSRINRVSLRFRTSNPCGVILYGIINSWSYLLIELVNGNIEINWSLRKDKIITRVGNSQLNDNRWHSIIILRYGKKVTVEIDQGRYKADERFEFDPSFVVSCKQSQRFFFGGYFALPDLHESKTKKAFSGCLQQIYINNDIDRFKITNEHIQKAKHYEAQVAREEYITGFTRVHGKLSTCDNENGAKNKEFKECGDFPEIVKYDDVTDYKVDKLSQKTVSWITAGICSGSIVIIFTLVCGFHFFRQSRDEFFHAETSSSRSGSIQYGAMKDMSFSSQYNTGPPMSFGVLL